MALCARVRIAVGVNVMKRLLVFLTLALSIGCYKERRPQLRSVKGLATEPTTWHGGAWDGRSGTAVTIEFKNGTEQFWRAQEVAFTFDRGSPPRYHNKSGDWLVADFVVPVMKREPHALTLFFSGETALGVLEQLPDQIEAGTLTVIPCVPNRVC
jgi:hypothetical protein